MSLELWGEEQAALKANDHFQTFSTISPISGSFKKKRVTDRPTGRPTDGQTVLNRDAWTHLKRFPTVLPDEPMKI